MKTQTHLKWAGPAPGYTLDDYRYGDDGPWPKINTLVEELPPVIDNVPQEQLDDFRINVVPHYRRILKSGRIKTIFRMLVSGHKLLPVADDTFAYNIFFGISSKLLTPDFNEQDYIDFKEFINSQEMFDERGEPRYLKVDTLSMNKIIPLFGIYSAPAVTLFRRVDKTKGIPLAIKINGLILTPEDGDAWELAKYFVLQGVLMISVQGKHPQLHFPMDAISAITLSSLPTQHLLYRLISPHTRIQLAINQAVTLLPYSVSHNNQYLPYTPFPAWGNIPLIHPHMGWPGQLEDAFCGIAENESYPAYKYPMQPEKNWTDLEDFLTAYHAVIYDFVSGVVRHMSVNDPIITYWSDAIAAWVPGFPNSQEIKQGDNLARAITAFIWDVSVAHSADHGALGQCQQNIFPLRIRVPPPASKSIPPINRRRIVTFDDTLRNRLCFSMYFGPPQSVEHLYDTWYNFDHPTLDHLNRLFLEQLAKTEKNLTCRKFISLKDIARSISF
ncbi:TPA: hypothetical protein ACJTCA_004179 [Yersinia enterocolitica]|uniref:hypothetical protein n=2 Tax=Yersinia enterocolitica TaxID=630 RepID=UPI002AC3FFE9|nr:hypothetical protein [Yersinia enterocolitica]HEN3614265.1 hypothetical protein [Yersinia enterocolitica]HEN3622071.1 hypothetical protein [Yersinia enterocolitica]HEN3640902.1 hypothetical protein [Yersinia enterocolitica]